MLEAVIIFDLRFAFFTHISGKKTHSFKICALKKRNDFPQLKKVDINTFADVDAFLSLCVCLCIV